MMRSWFLILFSFGSFCSKARGSESLFFSTYIEGSGYNKALSIYNPTGADVSLNGYAILECFNGCYKEGEYEHWVTFPANSGLNTGEDYIICDPSADSVILSVCDETQEYLQSGNDAFQLIQCEASCSDSCVEGCDFEILDSIGDFTDIDVGSWDVCGVEGATKDHSLFRLPNICEGNSNWKNSSSSNVDYCEWDVNSKNYGFNLIGYHTTTDCSDNGGRTVPPPSREPVPSPTVGVVMREVSMCPEAPSIPEDRRVDKTKLRIAQWNMDFLMLPDIETTGSMDCPCDEIVCADPTCDGASENCGSNCCGWGRLESRAHLRYVALELMKLDADVVHVAEVGDCGVLQDLIALLPDGHGYLPYMATNKDSFTGEHVGLITRIDPIEDLVHDDEKKADYPVESTSPVVAHASSCALGSSKSGSQGVSKHFVARIWPEGNPNPISLIGLHLLAVPDSTDRCGKREAQALVAATFAAEAVLAGDDVIIVGDMNDFDGGEAIQSSEVLPVTNALAILRNSTSPEMHNVVELVEKSERYSEWWDRNDDCYDPGPTTDASLTERSQLDHMLLSANLWNRIIDGTALMHHDWTGACVKDGGLFSDHWPLTVDLDYSEENKEVSEKKKCGNDTKLEKAETQVSILTTFMVLAFAFGIFMVALRWMKERQRFTAAPNEDQDEINGQGDGGVVMSALHKPVAEEGSEF